MRLPITPQISTKDGTSNKNARLTNTLKESSKSGDKAVIRPGLSLNDTYSGLGNGLIPFDGRLLVIYDDTVTDVEEETFPWPLDSSEWVADIVYSSGDAVWYLGGMWFSQADGNTGNTPGSGTSWSRSYEVPPLPAWDAGTTYSIGDSVDYSGTTYYSMAPSNIGNNPSSTPMWDTIAPTASRYRGYINILGMGAGNPGDECASRTAAAYASYSQSTLGYSCATKFMPSAVWRTYDNVVYDAGHPSGFPYRIYLQQWTDVTPFDCSGSPIDSGTSDFGYVNQTV